MKSNTLLAVRQIRCYSQSRRELLANRSDKGPKSGAKPIHIEFFGSSAVEIGIAITFSALLGFPASRTWGAVATGEFQGGFVENSAPQDCDAPEAHEACERRLLTKSIIGRFAESASMLPARRPRIVQAVAVVAASGSVIGANRRFRAPRAGGDQNGLGRLSALHIFKREASKER